MPDYLIISIFILAVLLTIGIVFSRLYNRSSKEISFVRTGLGGEKVVMDGGAIVFPVLHEIIPVNMNTLRLEVRRDKQQALITKDRMRVDVVAEFYVRVQPSIDSISNAAQTLGNRTMEREELKDLVEGKFVDALRSVAAEMKMTELHEKRIDFVQKVQQAVSEDLLKNGLELESVSLTGLDQTSREFFNPNNAFDAEGLTRLTQEIENRKKLRNDIEQDTEIQIKNKNLEAERKRLEIEKEEEYARLEQNREIEIKRANQKTEVTKEKAAREKEAELAQIDAQTEIEQTQILSKKELEEGQIEAERSIEEIKIKKEKVLVLEKVESDKATEEAKIQKERYIEIERVNKKKQTDLAEQEKDIAIAEKSKAHSEAQSEANKAKALSVESEERILTARDTEKAERHKRIDLIEAAKVAETDAIVITIAAEAEKKAASDKASALKIEAEAQSNKTQIEAEANFNKIKLEAEAESNRIKYIAEGESEADKLKAQAAEIRYAIEAKGKRELNEASNTLSEAQINMQLKEKLIENMEKIIRESVRPMEKIDGIKIVQVDGLTGGNSAQLSNEKSASQSSLSDQVVNSALKYRAQAPLMDSLLKEIGLEGGNIGGIGKIMSEMNGDSKTKDSLSNKKKQTH